MTEKKSEIKKYILKWLDNNLPSYDYYIRGVNGKPKRISEDELRKQNCK